QQQKLNERQEDDLHERGAVSRDVQHLGAGQYEHAPKERRSAPPRAHWSRTLNDLALAASRTSVIATSTSVSRQRYVMPTPLSMMPRAIVTNHRAGTMNVTHCSTVGMLSIGKTNPESICVGSIVP